MGAGAGLVKERGREGLGSGKPFCLLFGGLQKVGRLAEHDPPVLPLSLSQDGRKNFNFAGPGRQPAYFPCSSKESKQRKDVHLAVGTSVAESRLLPPPSLKLRAGSSSSVPIASRSGSFSRVARLLQTPALLVRETKSRDRAGGSPAKASSQGGTAAVNFAADRRNLRTVATGVPAARRKPIFAYFLAASKK